MPTNRDRELAKLAMERFCSLAEDRRLGVCYWIEQAIRTARAEQREADCKAVCQWCGDANYRTVRIAGTWWHIRDSEECQCNASAIREQAEKEKKEQTKDSED